MSWLIAAVVILAILAVFLPQRRDRRRGYDGGSGGVDGGHFWLWHGGSSHGDHHGGDGSNGGGCDGAGFDAGGFDGGGCDGGGGGGGD